MKDKRVKLNEAKADINNIHHRNLEKRETVQSVLYTEITLKNHVYYII